jgi:hypothetical protein
MSQLDRAAHPVYPTELARSAVSSSKLQSVAGSYDVDGDRVSSCRAYPLQRVRRTRCSSITPRRERRAEAGPGFEVEDFEALTIIRPRWPVQGHRVRRVYPTADEPREPAPVHLHFSGPMSEGSLRSTCTSSARSASRSPERSYRWNPALGQGAESDRPVRSARIKRGLAPHREAGYPLREASRSKWWSTTGSPMRRVGRSRCMSQALSGGRRRPPAHRTCQWAVEAPVAGHARSVIVRFDRPRPRAAPALPRVVDADAGPVPGGSWSPRANDREFTPLGGATTRLRAARRHHARGPGRQLGARVFDARPRRRRPHPDRCGPSHSSSAA